MTAQVAVLPLRRRPVRGRPDHAPTPRGASGPGSHRAPRTLSQAREFMEAHAAEAICADDIARAAAVTVRSVQLAFRRHLGTTPGSYLRTIRLQHAHAELLAARSGGHDTVAAVAERWGFSSASRFAAYYREAYGVLPSQTLSRSRRADRRRRG